MNFIKALIEKGKTDLWFSPDKAWHALMGVVAGLVGYMASSAQIGFGVWFAFIVALAKEVYDWDGHGTPSYKDFVMTWIPGSMAVLAVHYGLYFFTQP